MISDLQRYHTLFRCENDENSANENNCSPVSLAEVRAIPEQVKAKQQIEKSKRGHKIVTGERKKIVGGQSVII